MDDLKSKELFPNRPREINATEFVQQRAVEIAHLMSVVQNVSLPRGEVAQGPRTAVQRLPRHMRRRAMAHNAKRFPKHKRRMAQEGMSDRRPRKKPPSRYYKRRASHLSKVYFSRSRPGKHWLETHVWHAKRFHMVDFYGFKVASKSFQRSFRAAYRDAMTHCTVRDESFFAAFIIGGPKYSIVQRLDSLCCKKIGLTFNSSVFKRGDTQGQITLYLPNSYPNGCMGLFSFMWLNNASDSSTAGEEQSGRLLIWVHPAVINQFEKCLIDLFAFSESETEEKKTKWTLYANVEIGITLTIFRNGFNRFKLTGPKSTAIINSCLKRPDPSYLAESFPEYSATQTTTWKYWENYLSKLNPGQIKAGFVASLIVEDPRIHTDYKKAVPNLCHSPNNLLGDFDNQNQFAYSPLWDQAYGEAIRSKTISNASLDKKRSECAKLGHFANFTLEKPDLVPVLLVCTGSQNGNTHFGQGRGWDLILPSNWAMPFWTSLQYRTARAIGIDSNGKFDFECQNFTYPDFWPDTLAGRTHEQILEQRLSEKFHKRPPNRRTKYDALKIKYPFRFPWHELLAGWSGCDITDDFFVLRDRRDLTILSNLISGKITAVPNGFWRKDALVKVRISSLGKRTPKPFALLSLPTEIDCKNVLKMNLSELIHVNEKVSKDEQANKTKTWDEQDFISINQKSLLNLDDLFEDKQEVKLRNRRLNDKVKKKRRKAKIGANSEQSRCNSKPSGCEADQFEKCNNQSVSDWRKKNVVDSCCRKIAGFVMEGGYCFRLGFGAGLGMCSMLAIKDLVEKLPVLTLKNKRIRLLLYRNSNSKYYRACSVQTDLI